MANIKDFIKKIGNSAVSLEEQQQALAQVEQTIIEAKQKRTEAIGKNADMVVQALKTIEAKLEAKLDELNNTPAKQGVQGPAGKSGKDGKDGKNGRDGVNGKDGKDGKDGIDGQDGVSVIDAKIDFDGSLVIYLSNGNEIDAGQILQPEVAKNIIISSGGSGTSQVVTDTLQSLQDQINVLTGIDGTLGTMAQQDANAVAITGGTINGTTIGATTASTGSFTTLNSTGGALNGTIGATTPAAGTFTTIIGQTEVLRGTGQNLVLRSQSLTTAPWSLNNAPTTASTTDPLGGNTATQFTTTQSNSGVFQFPTVGNGLTLTWSVYVRYISGDGTLKLGVESNPSNATVVFNSSAGTITSSGAGLTATSVTNVGGGYYRISGTFVSTGTTVGIVVYSNNANATSFAAWGVQLEIGTTLNTYIPTTTTAVYGTPTLSFSGVAEIGLQSNGALYLQPAGTGAIQAQATTSTSAGGNARGANAVDWQTSRGNANQVASGQYSVVAGGYLNRSSAYGAVVSGGEGNLASAYDSIAVGGASNQGTGSYCFVGGGLNNLATGNYSFSGGGYFNTASGYNTFIGGGERNSGASNSAVTTQATTTVTNGSTAVTLSGSNANIKVGQLITGTGIVSYPNQTYVSAISGTSLTLSQNASASGSPTLSFFTPNSVVVGGGNNQATGSYSFIGGGGDAGTAANRNVASGDWSFVGGGCGNTASGIAAVICGGGRFSTGFGSNTASGLSSGIVSGLGNTATAIYSFVGAGNSNTANATGSFVGGGYYGTTRSILGNHVFSACVQPIASVSGVSQSALLILGRQTTDATATVLASDANAAGTTNQVILPNNSAYYFRGEIIAGVTGGGNTKGWFIEGVIKRGANAASTAIVGTATVTSNYADAGASTWAVTATADTTNGGLKITVTGQAATTIRWVAQIRTTEMTF